MNTGIFTREDIRAIRFEYQNLDQGNHQGNTFLTTGTLTRDSIMEICFEYWYL